MKKQMQFELWDECNSKCTFCHLCNKNGNTPNNIKLEMLQDTLDKISDLSIYSEYKTIGFIGGEFFQGQLNTPEIKSKFMELMDKACWLLNNDYIDNVWINATLTIGNQDDLYAVLKRFEGHKGNLWILTSYDTLGRFHTQKMKDNWDYHMKNIHKLYPEIKFNITTILSGDFIERYLNDEINFEQFMQEYNASLFFKVPALQKEYYHTNKEMNDKIGYFFPTRDLFLEFLSKFRQTEHPDLWNKLFNIEYRADTLYCKENGDDIEITRSKDNNYMETIIDTTINEQMERVKEKQMDYIMDCGHLSTYNSYIDEDGCALCDKLMFEELI